MLDNIFKTDRGALYIAEIGLNHNGDMDIARKMIAAAAGAGADAVKFQVFMPHLMTSVYTKDLLENGKDENPDESLIDFYSTFVFSGDQYKKLSDHAAEKGVVFFASVFDIPSMLLMENCKVPLYKLASSELTNHTLIKAVAETGKPLLLSTGMARESEIEMAVNLFRENSTAELALMHCVSLYPPQADNVNLKRINVLREKYDCHVGFSDHTSDIIASFLAVGQGARIFEKHFTIDRNYECPDKDISLTPEEFLEMADGIEFAVRVMGDGSIDFGTEEGDVARSARRSLFADRSITRGTVITEDDLVALRPGVGIPVYRIKEVVGKKSVVDIEKGQIIRMENLY